MAFVNLKLPGAKKAGADGTAGAGGGGGFGGGGGGGWSYVPAGAKIIGTNPDGSAIWSGVGNGDGTLPNGQWALECSSGVWYKPGDTVDRSADGLPNPILYNIDAKPDYYHATVIQSPDYDVRSKLFGRMRFAVHSMGSDTGGLFDKMAPPQPYPGRITDSAFPIVISSPDDLEDNTFVVGWDGVADTWGEVKKKGMPNFPKKGEPGKQIMFDSDGTQFTMDTGNQTESSNAPAGDAAAAGTASGQTGSTTQNSSSGNTQTTDKTKAGQLTGTLATATVVGATQVKGAASATKNAIIKKKVLALMAKNSGKIFSKSIAGLGIAVSAWDAVKHAAKGDWTGVGLDVIAGVASTLEVTGVGTAPSALAALVASVTSVIRDGYSEIYDVEPEKDPNFKANFNQAVEIGSDWVKEKLGIQAKKDEKGGEKSDAWMKVNQPNIDSWIKAVREGRQKLEDVPAVYKPFVEKAINGTTEGRAPTRLASGKRFNMKELVSLAESVGFKGDHAVIAAAIAAAESGGDSSALNSKPPDLSYGLWQINMINKLGPERQKKWGLVSYEALYDPLTNAKAAYSLYMGRKGGFQDWSTYGSGAYLNFLTKDANGNLIPTDKPLSGGGGGFGRGGGASTAAGVGGGGGGAAPNIGRGNDSSWQKMNDAINALVSGSATMRNNGSESAKSYAAVSSKGGATQTGTGNTPPSAPTAVAASKSGDDSNLLKPEQLLTPTPEGSGSVATSVASATNTAVKAVASAPANIDQNNTSPASFLGASNNITNVSNYTTTILKGASNVFTRTPAINVAGGASYYINRDQTTLNKQYDTIIQTSKDPDEIYNTLIEKLVQNNPSNENPDLVKEKIEKSKGAEIKKMAQMQAIINADKTGSNPEDNSQQSLASDDASKNTNTNTPTTPTTSTDNQPSAVMASNNSDENQLVPFWNGTEWIKMDPTKLPEYEKNTDAKTASSSQTTSVNSSWANSGSNSASSSYSYERKKNDGSSIPETAQPNAAPTNVTQYNVNNTTSDDEKYKDLELNGVKFKDLTPAGKQEAIKQYNELNSDMEEGHRKLQQARARRSGNPSVEPAPVQTPIPAPLERQQPDATQQVLEMVQSINNQSNNQSKEKTQQAAQQSQSQQGNVVNNFVNTPPPQEGIRVGPKDSTVDIHARADGTTWHAAASYSSDISASMA